MDFKDKQKKLQLEVQYMITLQEFDGHNQSLMKMNPRMGDIYFIKRGIVLGLADEVQVRHRRFQSFEG